MSRRIAASRWTHPLALATLLVTGLAPSGAAHAQLLGPDFTKDELSCMTKADGADAKAFQGVATCFRKCIVAFRRGSGVLADCTYPFGGATLACLEDAKKGVRTKAEAAIVKGCAKDVAECLVPGAASTIEEWALYQVLFSQAVLEFSQTVLWCDDLDGSPASKEVAKCEDSAAIVLAQLMGQLRKTYATCKKNEAFGKVALGSCGPPATDPKTSAKLAGYVAKAIAKIDSVCTPGFGRPACFVTGGRPNGAAWTTALKNLIESSFVPAIFCGE